MRSFVIFLMHVIMVVLIMTKKYKLIIIVRFHRMGDAVAILSIEFLCWSFDLICTCFFNDLTYSLHFNICILVSGVHSMFEFTLIANINMTRLFKRYPTWLSIDILSLLFNSISFYFDNNLFLSLEHTHTHKHFHRWDINSMRLLFHSDQQRIAN